MQYHACYDIRTSLISIRDRAACPGEGARAHQEDDRSTACGPGRRTVRPRIPCPRWTWHGTSPAAENMFLAGVASGAFDFGGKRPESVQTTADVAKWYCETIRREILPRSGR